MVTITLNETEAILVSECLDSVVDEASASLTASVLSGVAERLAAANREAGTTW